MKRIVDTINEFFAKREFYQEHGIPWNLKILFYGAHGTGKSSLVKMISSEWNRNLFECSGGKNGKFIPDAITGYSEDIVAPLFSISDIDKYPILINESNVDISNKEDKQNDEQLEYKQIFNKMINALDGIGTGENRIIIMTTNHIEKFSKTFLRPGRIDLIEEIGYVVPETFRRFVLDFYNEVIPENIELARDDISVAEMQADILFRKYDIGQFLDKYLKKNKKK
jgi:chaperone BCS1